MLSEKELEDLLKVDIQQTELCELIDLRDVIMDPHLLKKERLQQFLDQIKNPYCFRCGEVKVKIEFVQDAEPLQEVLISHFMNKR